MERESLPARDIRLSVRALVEFVLRSGSLDNRERPADAERMQLGSRIHRRLQREGGEAYSAEVPFTHITTRGDIRFLVEGRADGVIARPDGPVCIDEIKTVEIPLDSLTADFNGLHWAQAMCYAWFYAVEFEQEFMSVQLTYCHVNRDGNADGVTRFSRDFTREALRAFYDGLLARYEKWARFTLEWETARDESIWMLVFPFPEYRPGQYVLAGAAYQTIRDGGVSFFQAPTGIGKTISTLFPAVKAMGEGIAKKLFYLTAKTTTRRAAGEALARLRAAGLRLKSIVLTAKDKLCFQEGTFCNPEQCPYADGYFDRVNDAVWDGLDRFDHFDRAVLEELARAHTVCPFELSLDLALWCDCVVGDYNHLFDPFIYLKRFFTRKDDYVFLIDEAHNLVDRARELYSAALRKSAFAEVKKRLPKTGGKPADNRLKKQLNNINKQFLRKKNECAPDGYAEQEGQDLDFTQAIFDSIPYFEEWLDENGVSPHAEAVLELYFEALGYTRIAEFYDERYVTAADTDDRDVTVGQYCIDPSARLRAAMDRGRASVLFSATLTPPDYYAAVLGGDELSRKLSLPSPYKQDNLCLLLANRVSTRYRHREGSAREVAELIARTAAGRAGNYMAYFPSYQYMRMVAENFRAHYPDVALLMQESGTDEAGREAFLARFEAGSADTLIGFCVMGGIYAEGIDLEGDRLLGTVIVGVGLPQIGHNQDRIRDHFNRAGRDGYAYAYQYPGMNKVMQAAGRVIRGENDRGVVVLIDDRFNTDSYLRLFPAHWRHCRLVGSAAALDTEIRDFWEQTDAR